MIRIILFVVIFVAIVATVTKAIRNLMYEKKEQEKINSMGDYAKREYLKGKQHNSESRLEKFNQEDQENLYGVVNEVMMCPHCQAKGKVRTKHITQKKGVSGGKATAAILTGGVSLLAVGLSRKEESVQAHCGNCNNTWFF